MTKSEIKNIIISWDRVKSQLKVICPLDEESPNEIVLYKDPQAFEVDDIVREVEDSVELGAERDEESQEGEKETLE